MGHLARSPAGSSTRAGAAGVPALVPLPRSRVRLRTAHVARASPRRISPLPRGPPSPLQEHGCSGGIAFRIHIARCRGTTGVGSHARAWLSRSSTAWTEGPRNQIVPSASTIPLQPQTFIADTFSGSPLLVLRLNLETLRAIATKVMDAKVLRAVIWTDPCHRILR